jgi:hypothetical protein
MTGASGAAVADPRQQVELRTSPDRCAAVGHAELGVDVLGVGPDGVD